jgi:type IV pilus assembly protein PilA
MIGNHGFKPLMYKLLIMGCQSRYYRKSKEVNKMLKKIKKNQKGFTLVELVVVIAILAVLSALLVPRIMGNVDDARREREIADARTLASEIAVYNANQKTEVTPVLIQGTGTDGALVQGDIATTLTSWNTADAFPEASYVLIKIDADGNPTVEEVPVP